MTILRECSFRGIPTPIWHPLGDYQATGFQDGHGAGVRMGTGQFKISKCTALTEVQPLHLSERASGCCITLVNLQTSEKVTSFSFCQFPVALMEENFQRCFLMKWSTILVMSLFFNTSLVVSNFNVILWLGTYWYCIYFEIVLSYIKTK